MADYCELIPKKNAIPIPLAQNQTLFDRTVLTNYAMRVLSKFKVLVTSKRFQRYALLEDRSAPLYIRITDELEIGHSRLLTT